MYPLADFVDKPSGKQEEGELAFFSSLSDFELVQRCLQENQHALRCMIDRFQGLVWSLCLRLLRDHHESEDVAQEVFMRIFRGLKGWDPRRPLKPWIAAITVNRCRTQMARRNKRALTTPYMNLQPAKPDYTQQGNEWKTEIDAALLQLREDYREVFVLFHEEGMAYEEIAEVTGRPVGTVKTWLHRARTQVFEYLRDRGMLDGVQHELP